MKHRNRDMLSGPLFLNIVFYTVPIILTSILQLLFNAADLVIVGQFCGSISVAAVGATGSITNLLVNLFIGLSVGTGVTVAHGLGSRNWDDVQNTVHTALPVAFVCGAILTVVGTVYSESLLRIMGTPETVLPLSTVYMKIYFAGITFTLVYNFCASILRAAGDTRSPLLFLAISGVVNVVLNVIFVTVFHMNVAGVALATTISQGVSAVLVVLALMKRDDQCKMDLCKLRFHKKQLAKILRIGLPAGIQGSLFAISNATIQSSVNSFGDVFMSGNAAASNLESFAYASLNAFHQTAVNFISQNVGAKRYDRVNKILGICLGCTTVLGICFGVFFFTFGPQLLSIYIPDSTAAIAYGMIRLTIVDLPYFICGIMDVSTGALRGIGSSFIPMLISVLGVCGIRVGWVLTIFQIPAFHTPEWLYTSYPISWAVTFLAQILSFTVLFRKQKTNLDK